LLEKFGKFSARPGEIGPLMGGGQCWAGGRGQNERGPKAFIAQPMGAAQQGPLGRSEEHNLLNLATSRMTHSGQFTHGRKTRS